ncbi:ATP-binding protein, partial [Cypionkella sp.]|uniref:ATP-binding protein n=2 Tax=Cypionkella sp. TaxID=2811411 RepID=UPI002ABC4A50
TWELELATHKLHVGGRWGEILGLETSKLGALTVSDFVAMLHPDDTSNLLYADDFSDGTGAQIFGTEFRMRHRDGHWVWILSRSRVSERASDGTPLRISGVHLDISEQKQLEHDVFASRSFLLDVMDASSSAIIVLDGAQRISYVNQEAERTLGLIREIEPGQGFDISALMLERLDGEPLADDESPFQLALRASQPVRNIQCAFRHPDGGRRILSFNAALLDMGDQQFGVVSFSDVTENLTATQRLKEALMRAEEMSRAKSTFLANMSHEIRTPLNGVLGMAEVLADIVEEPLQRQMVDTIRKSGETLLTVLNGILDMSKIEAGKMVVESAPFVPLDLIRQAESIYTIAAEEKGVAFEVLATAGCDMPRLGDAHRLMQILNNLLNNAFKFTESGKVTLKFACRIGKPIQIEVSDTGIGIEPSQVSRLFESFEQADDSMTRRFGGTGLGLSIVRQLVTLMGGTITAESTPKQGAMFRIILPLPEAEHLPSAQVRAKENDLRENALVGLRLLCADDNETNRLVLSEMLARTGAVVTQVENGREAVEAWVAALDRNEPFALLLLDITMPVLDGMSALAEIRDIESLRDLPTVSAIAVTAHAMPSQIADYLIGGFDSHLAKPFRRLDLLHAIHSLLQL